MTALADRSALLIGAGGLGCPAAIGLAAAGIKRITLIDNDRIDPTNLARQVLFGDADTGTHKATVAARALKERFPWVEVRAILARFERTDAALVAEHDIVLDGSDNFPTRFAANDLCVAAGVPLIHGAAIRWLGQVMTILPGTTPCLRCIFEGEPPAEGAPTCSQTGVISPLVGVVGGWMAQAAIDVLSGRPVPSELHVIDALADRERLVPIGRDPECVACGKLTAWNPDAHWSRADRAASARH